MRMSPFEGPGGALDVGVTRPVLAAYLEARGYSGDQVGPWLDQLLAGREAVPVRDLLGVLFTAWEEAHAQALGSGDPVVDSEGVAPVTRAQAEAARDLLVTRELLKRGLHSLFLQSKLIEGSGGWSVALQMLGSKPPGVDLPGTVDALGATVPVHYYWKSPDMTPGPIRTPRG
jgi:hypothetical protein